MLYALRVPTHNVMTKQIHLLARLLLLLSTLALNVPASGQNTFNARITVTSQCNTQQALFGPQALQNVTVICQPGMTPYQTESFSLSGSSTDTNTDSDRDKTTDKGQPSGQQAQSQGGSATPTPSSKKVLSPPLPSASTFASKVIFVVF